MFALFRIFTCVLSFSLLSLITCVHAAVVNGPMLSHIDMREAKIWIQTDNPSLLRVAYKAAGNDTATLWSLPVETNSELANTAVITLDQVKPGTVYNYQIEINGELTSTGASFKTQTFYHGRTPAPDFRVAVGGAHYVTEEGFEPPYQILGDGYNIFSTILETKPDLMLWVGNTAHLRASEYHTKTGYLKRYSTARSVPEMQSLLAQIPNYGVWGNADYGVPFAGKHYSYRQIAKESFEAFWPRPVEIAGSNGTNTRFTYADVDFFLLDVHSYRDETPDASTRPEILGEQQLNWLRQELLLSKATFKVIIAGAPILNPANNRGNLSYVEREQSKWLKTLRDDDISGLFFISGGNYYGELTRLVHASSYNLYDLSIGPLTAKPKESDDELNFFRMPGSSIVERHFAIIDFTGPEEDRLLSIQVMGMEGNVIWSRSIKANTIK